jgi:hypothetical protein
VALKKWYRDYSGLCRECWQGGVHVPTVDHLDSCFIGQALSQPSTAGDELVKKARLLDLLERADIQKALFGNWLQGGSPNELYNRLSEIDEAMRKDGGV